MDQADLKSERRLPALAVSRGIGIGHVVFLHGEKRHFFRLDLDAADIETECSRLHSAVEASVRQLRSLATNSDLDPTQPVSSIFGVHLLMMEESSLIEKIETIIGDQKVNAEWALKIVTDQYRDRQISVEDTQLREKYLDIEDVSERLLNALDGSPSPAQLTYSGAVIVARELRPSTIMELTRSNPVALITEHGGWTSHTSILAREFKLPMASGIKDLEQVFSHGEEVIVDGINGQVILNPSMETIKHFHTFGSENIVSDELPTELAKPVRTIDGTSIAIRANVDIPEGYQLAKYLGAEGIGLFRSESLISQSGKIPSEDEQIAAYRQMAEVAGESGVKIRTFDVGIDQLGGDNHEPERNPSLGLRSIRLSLTDTTHFRSQIRAILRATVGEKIDVVLPMVSGVSEVLRSKAIIAEERTRLENEGTPIGAPKLGAMIEVPSGVLTAREIARKVDFLCLGTNDLVQYLLAVDRDNDSVAEWYQTLHPAVIRAISEVLAAAADSDIPVVVCGEMAGSAFYVPILIGLGARELSMNVNSIRQIRHLVSGITINESVALVDTIKSSETAAETEQILREFYLRNWIGLFPAGLLNSKHR
ncbi:MAG: phosphoenolpyruvate--protein phosphotransferase [Pyrinomonadaceae bacterium]